MGGPSDEQLRERTREQILTSLGGWSGTTITAIPPVVFVIVNALAHQLRAAIIAAVASGVLLAGYRLARRQPLQQAITGLFSVLIAALIAARTGQARGFFLLGIAGSICYGTVFAISLLIRRPLIGVVWEFLDPAPLPEGTRWYRVKPLRRAYDLASLAALAMFAARALVQLSLFRDNKTGWLAVTRIVMGFPLYLLVVAAVVWLVRRGRQQLPPVEPAAAEPEVDRSGADPVDPESVEPEPVEPKSSGGADRASDRGLGLGQRDE
jgi:hypothetical protein